MSGLRLATWNVRAGGFDGYDNEAQEPPRLPLIQAAVAALEADVVGLIDTYRWRALYTDEQLCKLFGYSKAFRINLRCEVVDRRVGITVLGNDRLMACVPVRIHDRNCLRAIIRVNGRAVSLYVVYATSFSGSRRRQEMAALVRAASQHSSMATLAMGDLNCLRPEQVPWPAQGLGRLRYAPGLANRNRGLLVQGLALADTSAVRVLRAAGFRDELAEAGPLVPTFHGSVMGKPLGFAVDYCWSRNVKVASCQVLQDDVFRRASDHDPVLATL